MTRQLKGILVYSVAGFICLQLGVEWGDMMITMIAFFAARAIDEVFFS